MLWFNAKIERRKNIREKTNSMDQKMPSANTAEMINSSYRGRGCRGGFRGGFRGHRVRGGRDRRRRRGCGSSNYDNRTCHWFRKTGYFISYRLFRL